MAASQAASFNLQEFTDAGQLLVGGRLYTYAYGTTAHKTAFTDPDGEVPHTYTADGIGGQYIALNARGELPAPLYLGGGSYDISLKRADGSTVWTRKADGVENSTESWIAALAASLGSSLIGFIQSGLGAVARTVRDELRERVSCTQFGAVGDGALNNSPALTKMLASLKNSRGKFELSFPAGDYLVGADVIIDGSAALRFQAGARLIIPDGVTLILNNVELLAGRQQIFQCTGTGKVIGTTRNDLVFPEWWGAIADGLHPPVGSDFSERAAAAARNAPALQAALIFAGYSYGVNGLTGTVSLSYGFYAHDKTLSVPLSVNVVGYGIGSGLFYYGATGNAVESIGTNNTMLKDFFIAPLAGPTWNFTSGFGLYMDGVSTPIVDNVWSSSFGAGTFFFRSVIEGRLRGLISDNSNGPAFTIRGVGQGTVLSNCVTAGNAGASFDIQSGYDWILQGCVGKDGPLGTNGFYLNAVENVNMSDCGCHSINREGIVLTSSTLNCTLVNCFVNDASMAANSIGTYDAISLAGKNNKLIAPKVTSNGPTYRYGLFVSGAATDCSWPDANIAMGTVGAIYDGQPIGKSESPIRKVTTTDATPTNIGFKALNNSSACIIKATVIAKQRGAAGESAAFEIVGRASTGAGGTTLAAPIVTFSSKSNASSTVNATLVLTNAAANGGVVSLQVIGLAGSSVDWEAELKTIAVTG